MGLEGCVTTEETEDIGTSFKLKFYQRKGSKSNERKREGVNVKGK